MQLWRNWHTRMIQVHVQATECGFKSHQLQYRKTAGKPLILLGFSAVLFLASFFELMRKRIKKFSQMVGNAIISALEFVSGIILNIILKWDVWDYTNYKINLLGQICFPFSFIWCLLALLAIIMDDYLRYWLFQEEKPRYRFFCGCAL